MAQPICTSIPLLKNKIYGFQNGSGGGGGGGMYTYPLFTSHEI